MTNGGWRGAYECATSSECAACSSQRLRLSSDAGVIAGLNIYSETADAFDERARATGLVLATHGGLLMNTILANDRVRNLRRALESNRQIGVAIGVLMHEHRLTQAQAFDVLRASSQDSNRKLADIAIEVVDTGTLSIRGWPAQLGRGRQSAHDRGEPSPAAPTEGLASSLI